MNLREKCFDSMSGAYAALFTPFEPLTDAQYAEYAKRCAKVHLKKVK